MRPSASRRERSGQHVSQAAGIGERGEIVAIWEELFKTSPIGIQDNFFELGGHSLLLMMLVARVEERLGERGNMAEIFKEPTIEHVAEVVRAHGLSTLLSIIVPMQTEGTKPPLFGPHPASEEFWCYRELVSHRQLRHDASLRAGRV